MYETIELSCECGRRPTRLREVGLTVDRQLVIYWRCSQCRRQVYRVKPLAECWRECPVPVLHGAVATGSSSPPLETN